MSLPQGLHALNLLRTVNRRVQASFETAYGATYTGRVNYGDPLFDPTALDARLTTKQYWTTLNFLVLAPGTKIPIVLQVDHFYEVGDEGDAAGDRFGHKVQGVADDFRKGFGRGGIASDRGFFVLDFTIPSAPVPQQEWLLIINSRGAQGMPDDETVVPIENGLRRVIQTWHVKSADDLASPQVYY